MDTPKESVTISIHFIDGGFDQWTDSPALLTKLKSLRSRGLEGKALVHELISDDWAAPPKTVVITDDATGDEVQIPYR
jgi:hypothetical protein